MKKLLPFLFFVTITVASFAQTTYTVNTTDDLPDININDTICADTNGNCTLRAAIENANKTNNKDTIAFDISGTAPFVISVTTEMLPAIMRSVIIDGTTQTGYTSTPLIEIEGSGVPMGSTGLRLFGISDNSEIYGLSIGGFERAEESLGGGYGIDVTSQSIIMQGNYIGLKPDGITLNRNQWGVFFTDSDNNTFGGTGANQGNVVSGNYSGGVTFSRSSNNIIQGNLLGTDATGTLSRGNRFNLQILDSSNNTIGGNTPEARNILAAGENIQNEQFDGTGISMVGATSTNNSIIGNYIGTDITGTQSLPNIRGGVLLLFGANNNFIGTDNVGEGNVISGNGNFGVYFQGSVTNPVFSNSIKGNYIGIDATGNAPLPNSIGIAMIFGVNNDNIIGGTTPNSKNVISGNSNSGIGLLNAMNNQIIGNYVGTNASGTSAIANSYGILIEGGDNTVGGQGSASRNIISGNNTGLEISQAASVGTVVIGNYVGLNALGTAAVPNMTGVSLAPSSSNSVIGGTDPLDRNIISGNSTYGISVGGVSHSIKNNYVGLNPTGTSAIPNGTGIAFYESSTSITIGGANALDRNIISGNDNIGMLVSGTYHTIQNNYVGLNPEGTTVIANNNTGMSIVGTLTNTQVFENTISGNGINPVASRNVYLFGANGVHFHSNYVGTLPDGNTGVVNLGVGIIVQSSSNNSIGGDLAAEGNIIGNHNGNGMTLIFSSVNNSISYNKIGVGADGTTNLGNAGNGLWALTTTGDNVSNSITKNIIANNKKGIELNADPNIETQFAISENSMYNNSLIGIDLIGTTENDVDDADTGVNNLQNTPEISAIVDLGDDALEVTYSVPSLMANSAYPMVIEFFGAANGQGKFFIEADTYAAPGNKTVTLNLPTGYDVNDYLTIVATATDANGNTSEFGISTDSTLSIAQFVNRTFKIYPNPVSDRLFIQSPTSGSYDLELVNALGQVILSQKNNNASIELEVSNLTNGLYFMNISSESGNSETIKFIKK